MSTKTIVITGASSGFGALSARALAVAGHRVYAGMRDTRGRNASAARDARSFAIEDGVDLRSVELDVTDQGSVDAAVEQIVNESGAPDVVIHNAGHMMIGPTEAFSTEEMAQLYDVNVLGTQRVNRAILPHLRTAGRGLLIWVGSSSTRGGTPPFLAPYFAAKAAMDALAVSYAAELIRFGIETTIVVPGPFTKGTRHFENSGQPSDASRAAEYDHKYGQLRAEIPARLAALEPAGASVSAVADVIVNLVGRPAGSRPFRVHIDPSNDGAEVVAAVADRMRVEFFRRTGLTDLLGTQPSL